jgi:hypothetical protein
MQPASLIDDGEYHIMLKNVNKNPLAADRTLRADVHWQFTSTEKWIIDENHCS